MSEPERDAPWESGRSIRQVISPTAAIHSEILGAPLFLAGIISIWVIMIHGGLLEGLQFINGQEKAFLLESVLLVGYFTARSFFESTAAFYGVDLLMFLPAVTYILVWLTKNPDFQQR